MHADSSSARIPARRFRCGPAADLRRHSCFTLTAHFRPRRCRSCYAVHGHFQTVQAAKLAVQAGNELQRRQETSWPGRRCARMCAGSAASGSGLCSCCPTEAGCEGCCRRQVRQRPAETARLMGGSPTELLAGCASWRTEAFGEVGSSRRPRSAPAAAPACAHNQRPVTGMVPTGQLDRGARPVLRSPSAKAGTCAYRRSSSGSADAVEGGRR